MRDRTFLTINLLVSGAAVGFLFWLIYFREGPKGLYDVAFLPAVNATLNTLSATCLGLGYLAIRNRRIHLHRNFMIGALCFSALFLVSYVIYHSLHGDTPFPGTGLIRPIYFLILISHIMLSIAVLPLVFATVFFALKGRFDSHRGIARWTLPIWFYVSITGVAIFLILRAYTST